MLEIIYASSSPILLNAAGSSIKNLLKLESFNKK